MGTTSSRSLRTKMVLVVLVATLGLVLVICFPLRAHILERFAAIERQLAADDLDAARNTIDAEIEAVGAMARDYGVWDETYAFVADDTQGPESEFVTSNFSDAMFTENRLALALIARTDGSPRYETRFVGEGEPRATPIPIRELLPEDDDVLGARAASGIVRTSGGLFLVGTHAILTSAETGERRGTLLLGRSLAAEPVAELAERVRLALSIIPLDGEVPDDLGVHLDIVRGLAPGAHHIAPIDDETLAAHALVRDVHGTPVAVLRVLVPRTVYAEGRADANFIAASVGVACLAFGLIVLLLLERTILRRVMHLGVEVGAVGAARDHSLRVSVSGGDELGNLARTVNEMLTSLERLNTELEGERAKAERLLRNVLPGPIAERLKHGEGTIADAFDSVTVLFADIVGFTTLSSKVPATELVVVLNDVFSRFDTLAERHGLEKIKTIGDAYMVVAGVPEPRPDHAVAVARMALDMLDEIRAFNTERGTELGIRIGIHSGPAVAGVIGKKKFIYDIWGDTVNTASRMESTGMPGRVQVSDVTAQALDGALAIEDRGVIAVKGKGEMRTWLLASRDAA
jgi:adenylate cyclase